jgi:hypothetical protein
MYIIKRTIEAGPGTIPSEVAQAVLQVAAYLRDKQGLDTETTVNVGGSQHEFHWIVRTDSLDILPAKAAEREADEEWQQLIQPMRENGLFQPGSIRDEILMVIG